MLAGGFDDGVDAAGVVGGGNVDFHVGIDAHLGHALLTVVHGAGGEAEGPAVGEFAGERQACAATRAVANDGDARQTFEEHYETVRGTKGAAICEDANGLLPAQALERLNADGLHGGEIVVARASLVLHIGARGGFVNEERGQLLRTGEQAAAVAPHIHNQAVAHGQGAHHFLQVATTQGRGEGGATDVAHIVRKHAVAQSATHAEIFTAPEIATHERVGEVHREIVKPSTVTRHIVGGTEIHVAVAKLCRHSAQ